MSGKSVAMLIAFLLTALPSLAAPLLQADRQEFDFGTVLEGTRVEHIFTFQNTGDRPLLISRVHSSCGCTAALLSASEIPPGGAGEIRTVFDSSRFRGAVSKAVYLDSNDPRQGRTTFHLRGTVRPKLEPSPGTLNLGIVAPGSRQEGRLSLINHSEDTIFLKSIRATAPGLEATLAATEVPPGKAVEVRVRAETTPGQRTISGYLLVRTEQPEIQELRIPVHGRVEGH